MRRATLLIIGILAAAWSFGCNNSDRPGTSNRPERQSSNSSETAARGNSSVPDANGMNPNNSANMSNSQAAQGDFWTRAAQGGLAEVELGRLAVTKTQNADVRGFAQTMVQDHTNANNELTALARKKNVSVPTSLDPMHQQARERLSALSGAELDREYMSMMVADHERTVQLFETQANAGTDDEVKAFAAKALPKLRQHLDMARNISQKLQ